MVIFLNLYVYYNVSLCALHVCMYPCKPEEAVGSPGTRVIGGYNLLDIGTETEPGSFARAVSAFTTEPPL